MLKLLLNDDGTLETAGILLTRLLNVKVTKNFIRQFLHRHSNNPSLTALSDCLSDLNIENGAFRINYEELMIYPLPLLAVVQTDVQELMVVTNVEENIVGYVDERGHKRNIFKQDFLEQWSGVVLAVNATENSGEKDYIKQRKAELAYKAKTIAALGSILLFFIFCTIHYATRSDDWKSTTTYAIMQLLSIFGLGVCILLLLYEVDSENKALKKICSVKKNVNCKAVLNSKYSKLLPGLTFSEIGFTFFLGNLCLLTIASFDFSIANSLISIVKITYAFSFIGVLISIYTQWKIIKEWCMMCLLVQSALFTGSIISFYLYFTDGFTELNGDMGTIIICVVLLFTIPLLMWKSVKVDFKDFFVYKSLAMELNRLKFNHQIFESILLTQKKIGKVPDNLGIILGNPDAANVVIKVCSPYCNPCAKAHPEYEKLLETYHGNIKLHIIFSATSNQNDPRSFPVKIFMAINLTKDKQLMARALDDWYNAKEKNFDVFAAKYQISADSLEVIDQIDRMYKWTRDNDITFTPTFFINDYQMPEMYSVQDIPNFLSV